MEVARKRLSSEKDVGFDILICFMSKMYQNKTFYRVKRNRLLFVGKEIGNKILKNLYFLGLPRFLQNRTGTKKATSLWRLPFALQDGLEPTTP